MGLITEFSDTVNDVRIRYSIMEKKRNIIAIGEMIKLARGHVNIAIPQVCFAILCYVGFSMHLIIYLRRYALASGPP